MYQLDGANWQIGQTTKLKGFFTVFQAIAGKSGNEIERLVGFRPGRLCKGWALAAAIYPPTPGRFILHASSKFAGGAVQGEPYAQRIERLHGENVLQDQLLTWARRFQRGGDWRAVKVVPTEPCDIYPPGVGIPQFEMPAPLEFSVVGLFSNFETCPRSLAARL